MAQEQNPAARVWRGAGIPVEQQGVKILGTPLGHPAYVQRFLNSLSEEHQTLLRRISATANFSLRCVDPEAVEPFARRHDQDILQCLSSILHQPSGLGYRDEGHRDVANVTGRPGSPQRTPHQQVSPLGKLG